MSPVLRFLGVGGAQSPELGSASGVLELDGRPRLMIDCGAEALTAYLGRYGAPPPAIYVTHVHMDHVGGLERLFYRAWFDPEVRGTIRIYAHAALIPFLQARIADYPGVLAEGGTDFWEAFRLIPLSRGFWSDGLWFDVFPTRHHMPMTSFGLALRGSFVWTGDTRPIPEMLSVHAAGEELVAHDCGISGNPSHTGLDDLEREYPPALRERLVLYHYASDADAAVMRAQGLRVARSGDAFPLHAPEARAMAAGE